MRIDPLAKSTQLTSKDIITFNSNITTDENKTLQVNKIYAIINDEYKEFEDMKAFLQSIKDEKNKVLHSYANSELLFRNLLNCATINNILQYDNEQSLFSNARITRIVFLNGCYTLQLSQFLEGDINQISGHFGIEPPNLEDPTEVLNAYHRALLLFNTSIYEITNTNITTYYSISDFSDKLWKDSILLKNYIINLPFHHPADKNSNLDPIMKSLYGPRVGVYTHKFKSKLHQITYDKVLQSNDYLLTLDINSSYGAAMCGTSFMQADYPYGIPYVCKDRKQAEKEFNDKKLGFYYVSMTPPTDLYIAPIPSKISEHSTAIDWNLNPRTAYYTSVDIEDAIKYNYKVEFLDDAVIYPQKFNPFREHIEKWFEIKRTTKSPLMRYLAKCIINHIYGKLLNKKIYKQSTIINTVEELQKLQNNPNIEMIDEDFMELEDGKEIHTFLDKTHKVNFTPYHLGAFILAYSRRLMNFYLEKINAFKSQVVHYIDTDSLRIHVKDFEPLKEYINPNMGHLKYDVEGLIFIAINRGPKSYSYQYIKSSNEICNKKVAAGIDADLIDEDYEADEIIVKHTQTEKLTFFKLRLRPQTKVYKIKWDLELFKNNVWFPRGYNFNKTA